MAVRITGAGVALTVGIIVVTGLIIGGLFWARQSGDQARRDEATQIAEQNLEEQSNDGVALNEGDAENESNTNEQASGESSEGSSVSGNEESASNGSGENMPATGANEPETNTVTELPATGPEDMFAIIPLGLTSFAAAAYIASQRRLSDLK